MPTPRFGLPYIVQGQAQKEMFHNEALTLLDAAVQARVESMALAAPPATPLPGQCWIVATGASGDRVGHAGDIALWSDGGWRFLAPFNGMAAFVMSDEVWAYRRDGAWAKGEFPVSKLMVGGQQVVGARGAAIAAPSGGATIDTQARSAIGAILAALVTHGLIAA